MFGKKSKTRQDEPPPPSPPTERLPSAKKSASKQSPDVGIFKEIIDNLPIALFAKDVADDYRFILWNKKQEEVMAIRRQDALGRTDFDLFAEESAAYFREMDEAVVKKGTLVTIPKEIVETKEADSVYLKTAKLPVEHNRRTILVGFSEDITEGVKGREQLEALNQNLTEKNRELEEAHLQLIQADKLESIGRLAAGVAHEVKNPLALLVLGVEYLQSGIDADDPNIAVILDEMKDAIGRADTIVRGLVDLSSDRRLEKQSTCPEELTDHVLLLLRHEVVRNSVVVKRDFRCDGVRIDVDYGKFEQVLLNVITNAIQAMDEAPAELHITVKRATLGDVPRNLGARDATHFRTGDEVVVFEISDTGSGIAADDLSKVYDPFFTTKATGAGTGLGLSVVRKIIELHHGKFKLGNREDRRGAVATILVPTIKS